MTATAQFIIIVIICLLNSGCGITSREIYIPEPNNVQTQAPSGLQAYYDSFINTPITDANSACTWTNKYISIVNDIEKYYTREGLYTFCTGKGNQLDVACIIQYELKGSFIVDDGFNIGVVYQNDFIVAGKLLPIPEQYFIVNEIRIKNR